jgi:hypothetical protein
VNNTQALQVNLGPANNFVNGVFTSVTVCEPGTSTCQTIPNVLVDTGSEGLRLLSSQVTLNLPQTTDASGSPLQECVMFADSTYVWGPVVKADVQLAGEKASSIPIQVISTSPSPPAPTSCSAGGINGNTVETLGSYGILGVGPFLQDCGSACVGTAVVPLYYACPASGCTLTPAPLTSQLANPVAAFPQDNNGMLVSFPAIPATGAPTASGSLIFGVGTQTDNALGGATVYTTDVNGNVSTQFNGSTYSGTYFDSGSNGLYLLDARTLGIPDCPGIPGYYCPASTVNYTATNVGANGASGQVSFSIANADALSTTGYAAFNDLGGPNPGSFDWGMPFFFGRNIFVGIESRSSSAGTGPYWAF